jgi:lipopolysaccharide biosynthesis glycosyltransferase
MFGPKIYAKLRNLTRGSIVWGVPDKEQRFSDTDIPIVITTDDAYTLQTVVMLTSLLESSNDENFYKIDILIPSEFSKENKEKVSNLQNSYKNCDIEFIDMKDCFKNSFISKHFSEVVYYRLRIPTVLETRKRCIYVDVDTIVEKDLLELYRYDMGNNWVAGVADSGRSVFYKNEEERKKREDYKKSIDLKSFDQYINSGVLLLNLEAIREDKVEDKFKTFLETHRDPMQHDQSTINSSCYGKICSLPFKYNAQMYMFFDQEENKFSSLFSEKDWNEGWNDSVIIHYAGEKPWSDPSTYRIERWWNFARKTPYWKEILKKFRTTK